MIKENYLPLGPFPLGIDNKHDTRDKVFDQSEQNLPRLVQATDIDIDNDGWIRNRPGTTLRIAGENYKGLFFVDNRLFCHKGDNLYEGTSGSPVLVSNAFTGSGLKITEHADAIWITDGTTHKVLRGTNLYNWGLSIPSITVTASSTSSSLEAGRYLVQASCTDSFGNEGPVSALSAVTLTAGQSIRVACTLPSDAVYLNIYASKKDQTITNFVAKVASGSLPYIFSTYPNEADPIVTHNMIPPISNANGIFSFRSWLMMWRDNVIFRSEAYEPHLFDGINIFQFEDDIKQVIPLLNGFWVGTEKYLYWVADLPGLGSDQDTTGWVPFRKYSGKIYPGGKKVNGTYIPGLETREEVALFMSEDGLIAAKADGSYQLITDDRYNFSSFSRATIEYNSDALNQILIGLVN
jgi:hypothetical protein